MAKDLAIVLVNGGVNSAVAAALAAQKHRLVFLIAEVLPPTPGAGGRAAYDQQVAYFKPYREHTLPLLFLNLPKSAKDVPPATAEARRETPLNQKLVEQLGLLGLASRFATHYHATALYTGLRVGPLGDELAQAAEYGQIWNELLQLPCGQPELEVTTPLLELEPWQVVDLAFQVNAPLDKTWSCIEDQPEPCWACPGCRAREAAFEQSGKPDPLRSVKRGGTTR